MDRQRFSRSWIRGNLGKMLAGVLLAVVLASWVLDKILDRRETDRQDRKE